MEIYSRSDRSITQRIIANQCATNMDVLLNNNIFVCTDEPGEPVN